jgi:2-phospho-L-lactate guanylyltransferase
MRRNSGRGPRAGVVLPIRSFALGKARLASELDAADRAALGQRLADRVADAAAAFPTVVVSSAPEVQRWAAGRGFPVLDDPGSLDAAAAAGAAHHFATAVPRVVVAHADLALATSFERLVADGDRPVVALVPCQRDDGTNVLSLPLGTPFAFAYGPGSFRRHATEARRLGLAVRVVRDPDLAFDVDLPEDLAALEVATPR